MVANIEVIMAKSSIERLKHETDNLIRFSDDPIKKSQTERIIDRFGTVTTLHARLNDAGLCLNISTIYRWKYPKNRKGTGGMIPARIWPYLMRAALLEGIYFMPEDFDPRPKF